MARIGKKIELSDADFQELLTRSRSQRLDYRFVLRAKIILFCAESNAIDVKKTRFKNSFFRIKLSVNKS